MIMEYLEYHPVDWDKAFISERDNLLFLLPQFKVNVEHIGATSVNNCRSFRNVDILVSTHNFTDIHTIAMMLCSKEYKELKELSTIDCVVLVKKYKVNKRYGVTVRVVQYASNIYNRIVSFKLLLKDSYDRVQKYNLFREQLFKQVNSNIAEYNKVKYDYINSLLDDNYKFE